MQRLILAGAGHAQLSVLHQLAHRQSGEIDAILVTPSFFQYYSGMLPGWMAGHYTVQQSRIDLRPLIRQAGVRLVLGSIAAVDANARQVRLLGGGVLDYDLLSLDTGSELDLSRLALAGNRLLAAKPSEKFQYAWQAILEAATVVQGYRLLVVGGGAAGVELALGAQAAFHSRGLHARVQLVATEAGLLPNASPGFRQRVVNHLFRAGIVVHASRAAGIPQGLLLACGKLLEAECVLAATGGRAPAWLQASCLTLRDGFVAVDGHQRSISHSNVFAAGDICARIDARMARSGVHAVKAGPVLAVNLAAALARRPMLHYYHPRLQPLSMLACGRKYAIAGWGRISVEGRWVWYWKDRIDRAFVRRHSEIR